MSIRTFIRRHRKELDEAIIKLLTQYDPPNFNRDCGLFNDEARRQWILNDDGLYNWARSEGVKI